MLSVLVCGSRVYGWFFKVYRATYGLAVFGYVCILSNIFGLSFLFKIHQMVASVSSEHICAPTAASTHYLNTSVHQLYTTCTPPVSVLTALLTALLTAHRLADEQRLCCIKLCCIGRNALDLLWAVLWCDGSRLRRALC